MSSRDVPGPEAREAAHAWESMARLVEHVERGGTPAPVRPTVMLRPGELQHGAVVADLSVFTGADVEYESSLAWSGGLLFGAATLAASAAMNAHNKRRAEDFARPQWRPQGRRPVTVTNRRLLVVIDHMTSFHYGTLVALEPHPPSWSAVLHFEGWAPLMLRGPWVPWMTVVICASLYQQPWPPGFAPPPAPAAQRAQLGRHQPAALAATPHHPPAGGAAHPPRDRISPAAPHRPPPDAAPREPAVPQERAAPPRRRISDAVQRREPPSTPPNR